MQKNCTIVWFRQDLRVNDNPALVEAAKQGAVLPIFILDDVNAKEYALGAASRWWLHHSLISLNKSLKGNLSVYRGDASTILPKIMQQNNVQAIYWNRCYEPWRIKRDKALNSTLKASGYEVRSFNGFLLWEPWETLKKDGTPYKVFTPYYRKGCLNAMAPRQPLAKPKKLNLITDADNKLSIEDLALIPDIPWYKIMQSEWNIGESAAKKRLKDFLEDGLSNYKEGRNFPAQENVSRLSPHLHFGEISTNQVWYAAQSQSINPPAADLDCFMSELGWREFSNSLLYYFPDLPRKNLATKFDKFPWVNSTKSLRAWQTGQTGYPIVDAGMRELWQTGYMHNRVRMIVGSFLVKNLLLHWHHGEAWFWDCLVDADLASNSASWQWIAGCGADAAPYFRIFNPVTQGQKFDPEGEYTLRFVPELAGLPAKYLFNPWDAPEAVLEQANIVLGKDYPKPVVDLKFSRQRALSAFTSLKNNA